MPFGIDVDMEKAKQEIQDTLEKFCTSYISAFQVSLVEKVIADSVEAKEDEADAYQLSEIPAPTPPEKEGSMKKRSTILGRWKDKHFWINDQWELAFSDSKEKKENPDVINLWGYKVQGLQVKPEGPRKGGPDWIPDEERPNCVKCNKGFTQFIWHHHCRNCGEVFCSDCAGNKMELNHFGYEGPQRSCDGCFEKSGGGRARATTFAVSSEEAKADAAFHGIQLLHVSRTPYVLECATLEDKKAWMEVIKTCIANASAPINSDPVLASAFEAAHKEASWAAGIYGWWRVTGDESEMVSDLISHQIYRSVVAPAIDGAPENIPIKMKRMATDAINKTITNSIRAAVGPAWKAVADKVKDMRGAVEEKIKPAIESINNAKNDLMDKMKEGVAKVLDPIMEKVGSAVLDKVMPKVSEPVLNAHKDTFAILSAKVQEVAKASTDQASFGSECAKARNDLHYWWGPMRPVNEGLDDFRRDVQDWIGGSDLLSHISVSKLTGSVHDGLHKLLDNALYSLEKDESLANEVSEAKVLEAWQGVNAKVLHDSKMLVANTYNEILGMALKPPVQDPLLQSEELKAVTEPLDALIPEVVAAFISISSLLEEFLDGVLDNAISKVVEAGKNATEATLTQAHAQA